VRRTALIVGAGIGGLSTGIALRRAGCDVRIFEQAPSARELGFGLVLAPNAMHALRELGLADALITRGFAPTRARGEIRRMDGTVLKRADFPVRAALGGPMVVALRPALHGVLLDAIGTDAITLGTEVTGFDASPQYVVVRFSNGETATGDLLVGADGVGSVVRRTLHPSEPPPRSSHIGAVRGTVHGAVRHLRDLWGVYYLGPGLESFLVRASDTGIYWALSVALELLPKDMRDPREILAFMSPKMDATFRVVTSTTDDLRFDELVDRDPISQWGTGRVTLLGDAAHPMLPHTGQGAAQAIVDAMALGKALAKSTDVESALRGYEREREKKTAALVGQGRRTARVMRMRNPMGCWIREQIVRLMPVNAFAKLLVRINRRAGTDVPA
jgi:2-polyprenyl-6-methoxyphenol hydroxylase-like FAD-dependent oxidoreductase